MKEGMLRKSSSQNYRMNSQENDPHVQNRQSVRDHKYSGVHPSTANNQSSMNQILFQKDSSEKLKTKKSNLRDSINFNNNGSITQQDSPLSDITNQPFNDIYDSHIVQKKSKQTLGMPSSSITNSVALQKMQDLLDKQQLRSSSSQNIGQLQASQNFRDQINEITIEDSTIDFNNENQSNKNLNCQQNSRMSSQSRHNTQKEPSAVPASQNQSNLEIQKFDSFHEPSQLLSNLSPHPIQYLLSTKNESRKQLQRIDSKSFKGRMGLNRVLKNINEAPTSMTVATNNISISKSRNFHNSNKNINNSQEKPNSNNNFDNDVVPRNYGSQKPSLSSDNILKNYFNGIQTNQPQVQTPKSQFVFQTSIQKPHSNLYKGEPAANTPLANFKSSNHLTQSQQHQQLMKFFPRTPQGGLNSNQPDTPSNTNLHSIRFPLREQSKQSQNQLAFKNSSPETHGSKPKPLNLNYQSNNSIEEVLTNQIQGKYLNFPSTEKNQKPENQKNTQPKSFNNIPYNMRGLDTEISHSSADEENRNNYEDFDEGEMLETEHQQAQDDHIFSHKSGRSQRFQISSRSPHRPPSYYSKQQTSSGKQIHIKGQNFNNQQLYNCYTEADQQTYYQNENNHGFPVQKSYQDLSQNSLNYNYAHPVISKTQSTRVSLQQPLQQPTLQSSTECINKHIATRNLHLSYQKQDFNHIENAISGNYVSPTDRFKSVISSSLSRKRDQSLPQSFSSVEIHNNSESRAQQRGIIKTINPFKSEEGIIFNKQIENNSCNFAYPAKNLGQRGGRVNTENNENSMFSKIDEKLELSSSILNSYFQEFNNNCSRQAGAGGSISGGNSKSIQHPGADDKFSPIIKTNQKSPLHTSSQFTNFEIRQTVSAHNQNQYLSHYSSSDKSEELSNLENQQTLKGNDLEKMCLKQSRDSFDQKDEQNSREFGHPQERESLHGSSDDNYPAMEKQIKQKKGKTNKSKKAQKSESGIPENQGIDTQEEEQYPQFNVNVGSQISSKRNSIVNSATETPKPPLGQRNSKQSIVPGCDVIDFFKISGIAHRKESYNISQSDLSFFLNTQKNNQNNNFNQDNSYVEELSRIFQNEKLSRIELPSHNSFLSLSDQEELFVSNQKELYNNDSNQKSNPPQISHQQNNIPQAVKGNTHSNQSNSSEAKRKEGQQDSSVKNSINGLPSNHQIQNNSGDLNFHNHHQQDQYREDPVDELRLSLSSDRNDQIRKSKKVYNQFNYFDEDYDEKALDLNKYSKNQENLENQSTILCDQKKSKNEQQTQTHKQVSSERLKTNPEAAYETLNSRNLNLKNYNHPQISSNGGVESKNSHLSKLEILTNLPPKFPMQLKKHESNSCKAHLCGVQTEPTADISIDQKRINLLRNSNKFLMNPLNYLDDQDLVYPVLQSMKHASHSEIGGNSENILGLLNLNTAELKDVFERGSLDLRVKKPIQFNNRVAKQAFPSDFFQGFDKMQQKPHIPVSQVARQSSFEQ